MRCVVRPHNDAIVLTDVELEYRCIITAELPSASNIHP